MSNTPLGYEVSDFLTTISQYGTKNDSFEILSYNYANRDEIAKRTEAERQRKTRQKKARLISACICVVLLVIAGIVINSKVIIPTKKYNQASDYMTEGKYKEALSVLNEISLFRDSDVLIEECRFELYEPDYLRALSYMEEGQYQEAIISFRKTNGYKNSYSLIRDCEASIKQETYNLAMAYMRDGAYDAAINKFESIRDYGDSAAMAEKCKQRKLITPIISADIGETVFLGSYEQDNNSENGTEEIEWIVLDKTDESALLLSKYGLDYQQYHNNYSTVTWETSSLRTWMNDSFLNNAFSDDELSIIKTTNVIVKPDVDFETADPGNNTNDRVFALSINEVYEYFDSDESRMCQPTSYAKRREVYVNENGNCWWWLRSPGQSSNYALLVASDGIVYENYANGYGRIMPIDTGSHWGRATVRPAMWIGVD